MANKFTEATPFGGGGDFVYEDMRGNHWNVRQRPGAGLSQFASPAQWVAAPAADAAAAYELTQGKTFTVTDSAKGLIGEIESRLEAARAAGQSPGEFFKVPGGQLTVTGSGPFPWWLVVLGVAAYYHSKKRRR